MKTATTYQLYLGRHIDVLNRTVSGLDFSRFIKEMVVPHFPSFAVVEGTGYWKGTGESIFIITIISEDYYDAVRIHEIAEEYKRRFYQDAVLVNTFSSFPNLV